MKEKGFTLIELVLMIGLLVLTAGVSSDIIITLIRSYNKTQITTEIEQSADFILLKMEKELRNAKGLYDGGSAAALPGNTLNFVAQNDSIVSYRVLNNVVSRAVGSPTGSLTWVDLNDSTFLGGGVSITCGAPACFSNINTTATATSNPIIAIRMTFRQTTTAGTPAFTGEVPIDTTIVMRNR